MSTVMDLYKINITGSLFNWWLDVKIHGLTQAAADYHKVVAENRELYNQVQDLKGFYFFFSYFRFSSDQKPEYIIEIW